MGEAYSGGCVGSAPFGMAHGLQLAATPCFVTMALLTQLMSDEQAVLICSGTSGALPLTGMVAMYWLMSIFHAAPWLRLISGWRSRAHRP